MDNEKLQPRHDEKSEVEARRKMLYAMHDSHFLSDAELKRDLKALEKSDHKWESFNFFSADCIDVSISFKLF